MVLGGPPFSMDKTSAPLLWMVGWGRDSGSLLWEEHPCFMKKALGEDGERGHLVFCMSLQGAQRCEWAAASVTGALYSQPAVPGVDLLSYQWGLGGGGETPHSSHSCLESSICSMDLGVERALRTAGGSPFLGRYCSSRLGACRERRLVLPETTLSRPSTGIEASIGIASIGWRSSKATDHPCS